jgi:hypothetical protein
MKDYKKELIKWLIIITALFVAFIIGYTYGIFKMADYGAEIIQRWYNTTVTPEEIIKYRHLIGL